MNIHNIQTFWRFILWQQSLDDMALAYLHIQTALSDIWHTTTLAIYITDIMVAVKFSNTSSPLCTMLVIVSQ